MYLITSLNINYRVQLKKKTKIQIAMKTKSDKPFWTISF